MKILGIETSCDETGVAIFDADRGLLAHILHSQVQTHAQYGGVVPELASRDHIQHISLLTQEALQKANITPQELSAIAYTQGPGLVGALLVGACFAKSLAYAYGIPALAVHHMEGHLLASFLEKEHPEYPFLALLVSGGHTQIIQVNAFGDYVILGQSLDDAAGEAFDKTAKLLGLSYPGGPQLAKIAESGVPGRFTFPRPMQNKGLDFSFSGLKTHALLAINAETLTEQTKADLAYAFEDAVVDTLITKVTRALLQTELKALVVAGGVGANKKLRSALDKLGCNQNIKIYYPRLEFCTDNGAMIAYAGYERFRRGQYDSNWEIQVRPRWPFNNQN